MGHRGLLVMQRHQLGGLMGLFSIAQSWAGRVETPWCSNCPEC